MWSWICAPILCISGGWKYLRGFELIVQGFALPVLAFAKNDKYDLGEIYGPFASKIGPEERQDEVE